MATSVRGLQIDPKAQTVTEVFIDDFSYEKIYEYADCDLYTCLMLPTDNAVMFLDDEGLLKPNPVFVLDGNIFAGKALILGDRHGESVSLDAGVTAQSILSRIAWLPDKTTEDLTVPPPTVFGMDDEGQCYLTDNVTTLSYKDVYYYAKGNVAVMLLDVDKDKNGNWLFGIVNSKDAQEQILSLNSEEMASLKKYVTREDSEKMKVRFKDDSV